MFQREVVDKTETIYLCFINILFVLRLPRRAAHATIVTLL